MNRGNARHTPDLEHERTLQSRGYTLIAGIDEAGRGAWAGPVYAAAVILPLERADLTDALDGVTDSKLLTPRRREALIEVVRAVALAVGVGWASAAEIDALGILPATRLAMRRATGALAPAPEALLLDYVVLPEVRLPQTSLPKADQRCLSVAAASIVAKVSRDRWMLELDRQFPGYGLARHKGYGTAAHRSALEELGPSPVHRTSWTPLRALGKRQNQTSQDDFSLIDKNGRSEIKCSTIPMEEHDEYKSRYLDSRDDGRRPATSHS